MSNRSAAAKKAAKGDVRPLEEIDGNIKCQYCGCLTNARLRACCENMGKGDTSG